MWWHQKSRTPHSKKAVAYYRHSAQDRQENSIPIQREKVKKFADEHGISIIEEFKDPGKSGLTIHNRPGFNTMMQEYVIEGKKEFDYILVLDVSRWGRFQDTDLSAFYTGQCRKYGKQVIYTSMGFPREGDLVHSLRLSIERFQAANYSRELSQKVFDGCVKIAQQGFRAGGTPPYGLCRLLLDEQRNPVQVLKPGQHKSIHNQRVTLAPGAKDEIGIVNRIFSMFVKKREPECEIAAILNDEEIPSPGGTEWTSESVRNILTNEQYIGTIVYNKTWSRLKRPSKRNPYDDWIRTENAFESIVDRKLFYRAQEFLAIRKAEHERRYSSEDMLERLDRLYKKYGKIGPRQIAGSKDMVSAATYKKRFDSLDMAYQQMYRDVLDKTRKSVLEKLQEQADGIETYSDYIVIDNSFSVLIQPSVPMLYGYREYWAFRPDPRREVDITLGVPLSNSNEYSILGYLILPRMLTRHHNIRLSASSEGYLALHGHFNLDFLQKLMD